MSIINKLKAVADIIAPPVGYKTLFIRSDTGVPALMDSDGNVANLSLGGDASGVTYTPLDVLDWTDSVDPGNVAEALDDLAVRLNTVETDNAIPPDAAEVTYEPQTSLHWTDSEDPGNVDAALDDLAARVNSLEENPGGGVTDAADLTYTPLTLGNWNSSADPGDTADALDQLASRAKTLETAVVDASVVTFTPANPIHWTDSEDPGDVDDALNDLGSRVQALEENGGGGAIVQVKNFQTGASSTGTATIPIDDTIPQNTEGTEFMTLAITPTNASNLLRIDVVANLSTTATPAWYMVLALFQDSTANALACALEACSATDGNVNMKLTYVMTAGTTSATTFKVRAGANGAGTTSLNGRAGGRLYGGVLMSGITITEIVP